MREQHRPSPVSSTPDPADLELGEFIPAVTPEYSNPRHLAPILDIFHRIDRGDEVHAIISIPPRHGKSETVLHGAAWLLKRHNHFPIAYVSYAAEFAAEQCRKARAIARRAMVPLGEKVTEKHWETANGGGVHSEGVQGQLTGRGFKLIITDDPVKNRKDAESPAVRRRINNGWRSDIYTRRQPTGTSDLIVMARWHEDDLAGEVERAQIATGHPWEVVNCPALSATDEPLAPGLWDLAALLKIRATVGKYVWDGLYQGRPPRGGGQLFQGVRVYDSLPGELRYSIGVDLAYTAKTAGDWSVAVVLGTDHVGRCYVVDVIRRQVEAPDFEGTLRLLAGRYPGAPMRWYQGGGGEKGVAQFFRVDGLPLHAPSATADKKVRALPVSAAWNGVPPDVPGRVLVPASAPWLADFLSELERFTGIGDDHDDQVDALAAAFDALQGMGVGEVSLGAPRVGVRGALGLNGGVRSHLR